MKVFLDTNVLVDITANREPFSKWAIKLVNEAKNGKFELYTSTLSILTTYYLMEMQLGDRKCKRILNIILNRVKTQDIDHQGLLTGITSKFRDYEDAVQHECARRIPGIRYIVTRNKKDFKYSVIETVSPEELFV